MKQLDEYIHREKEMMPSPFLADRIIEKIGSQREIQSVRVKVGWWQSVVVAASMAAVIALGIALGSSLQVETDQYDALAVNDSQIENFTLLTADENQ